MAIPRSAIRASILTSIKSSKSSGGRAPVPHSLRTPAAVQTNEVNPLKRLSKSLQGDPRFSVMKGAPKKD